MCWRIVIAWSTTPNQVLMIVDWRRCNRTKVWVFNSIHKQLISIIKRKRGKLLSLWLKRVRRIERKTQANGEIHTLLITLSTQRRCVPDQARICPRPIVVHLFGFQRRMASSFQLEPLHQHARELSLVGAVLRAGNSGIRRRKEQLICRGAIQSGWLDRWLWRRLWLYRQRRDTVAWHREQLKLQIEASAKQCFQDWIRI